MDMIIGVHLLFHLLRDIMVLHRLLVRLSSRCIMGLRRRRMGTMINMDSMCIRRRVLRGLHLDPLLRRRGVVRGLMDRLRLGLDSNSSISNSSRRGHRRRMGI